MIDEKVTNVKIGYEPNPSCKALRKMWKDMNEPIPMVRLMGTLADFMTQAMNGESPLMTSIVAQMGEETTDVLYLWATHVPNLTPIGRCIDLRKIITEKESENARMKSEIERYEKLLAATVAVLERAQDVWCGGAEDLGLEDDLSTLRNQIRKAIRPVEESQEIEF